MRKYPLLINSMNFGAITGLAIVVVSILVYSIGAFFTVGKYIQWISFLILIAGMAIGTNQFKKNNPEVVLKYGKALGSCFLIGLFASIILGFYNYIFFKFIDPSMIEQMLAEAENVMATQYNMPEEQINAAIEMQRKFMTPASMFLFSILGMAFWSFLLALLVAIFVKHKKNEYENVQ